MTWSKIKHIFLNEEFNLAKNARQAQITKLHMDILSEGAKPALLS